MTFQVGTTTAAWHGGGRICQGRYWETAAALIVNEFAQEACHTAAKPVRMPGRVATRTAHATYSVAAYRRPTHLAEAH